MDKYYSHLLRHLMEKKQYTTIRLLICALVLVGGIAASLLITPHGAALAYGLAPKGNTLASQNSPCHLPKVSTQEGPLTRYDVFQNNQANPIGTVIIQLFYCNSYQGTYYQSTFARFTYHARDPLASDAAPDQIYGSCRIIPTFTLEGSSDKCVLQNNIPFDSPIIPRGPGQTWTATWSSSSTQCMEDESSTSPTGSLASTCPSKEISFSSTDPAGSSYIACDKYAQLDPVIKSLSSSSTKLDAGITDHKQLFADVLGYYDSSKTYCGQMSAKVTIVAPPNAVGGRGYVELLCNGTGTNCNTYRYVDYKPGGSTGYTKAYYSGIATTNIGLASAGLLALGPFSKYDIQTPVASQN